MYNIRFNNKDISKVRTLKTLKGAYKAIYDFLQLHKDDRQVHVILTGPGIGTENYSEFEAVPYTPKPKKDFLLSSKWSELRMLAMERDNYRCQVCGKSPSDDNIALEVHHKIERSVRPDLEAELTNLTTLCKQCHQAFTNRFNRKQ